MDKLPCLQPVERVLVAVWPVADWIDLPVVAAVSGGADSVALLTAMARIRAEMGPGDGRLIVAHFNHRLRAAESDADEAFVSELAGRLGLDFRVGRAGDESCPVLARHASEANARHVRYRFLRQTAEAAGARYLATAHTADDQAETVLHRIVRGTGLAGLAGIRRVRALGPAVSVVRPFLSIRRSALVEYLGFLNQPFQVDASNRDVRFTRNHIRHRLLPELAARYNPAIVEALVRLGGLAAESQTVWEGLAGRLFERCVVLQRPNEVRLDLGALAGEPPFLVRELLMAVWRSQNWPLAAMGFSRWDDLATRVQQPRGLSLPGGVSASVESGVLCLVRGENTPVR